LFVTLNPHRPPQPGSVIQAFEYTHPLFDAAALAAQNELWQLQGVRNTWFCGSYFGYGFHEDALQSGLAVADRFGVPAPWAAKPSRIATRPLLEPAQ
jgi:predicted NAD/FAD-binding protein